MNDTYDGFKIADEDLKLRGPGEFFGTKQSGIPCFNLANPLGDRQLLESARECATLLLNMEEGRDYVKKVIENRYARNSDFSHFPLADFQTYFRF